MATSELSELKYVELQHPISANRMSDFVNHLTAVLGKTGDVQVHYRSSISGTASRTYETIGSTALQRKGNEVSSLELALQFSQHQGDRYLRASCDGKSDYETDDKPMITRFTFFTTPGYELEELDVDEVEMIRRAGRAMREYKPTFP